MAEALGSLAVQLHAQADPAATLRAIVAAATDIVPGISWAGVSQLRGRAVTPSPPADDVAQALDQLQNDTGVGPTLDSLVHQRTVLVPDLRSETRWPKFVRAATDRGVHCLAAFRLFVAEGNLGVLTLYGPEPNLFDDEAVLYGELLAQHAAVAMAGAQAEEQMHRAIASRDTIGQAKGIIMERLHVNAVRAFELLTRLSQDNDVKLVEVARQVIATTDGSGPNTMR